MEESISYNRKRISKERDIYIQISIYSQSTRIFACDTYFRNGIIM